MRPLRTQHGRLGKQGSAGQIESIFCYCVVYLSPQMFLKTFLRATFSCKWRCVFVYMADMLDTVLNSHSASWLQQVLWVFDEAAVNYRAERSLYAYNSPLSSALDQSESSIQPSRVIMISILYISSPIALTHNTKSASMSRDSSVCTRIAPLRYLHHNQMHQYSRIHSSRDVVHRPAILLE